MRRLEIKSHSKNSRHLENLTRPAAPFRRDGFRGILHFPAVCPRQGPGLLPGGGSRLNPTVPSPTPQPRRLTAELFSCARRLARTSCTSILPWLSSRCNPEAPTGGGASGGKKREMIFYMARKSKVNEYLLKKSYIPRGEERNESTQNMSCSCCICHTSSYEKS